jgi:hypothetical protein
MTEKLIAQWKTILGLFATEPKEVLAKELVKMIPMKPDFEVDWRRGSAYNPEKGMMEVVFTIIVKPVFHQTDIESVDLEAYFSDLIMRVPPEDWEFLEESFELVLEGIESPAFRNSIMPCVQLEDQISLFRFYVEGKPSSEMTSVLIRKNRIKV